ncbi:MAG: class I SAM-dependent methyltransferase [Fimbriimonadaceae bacterium]|nr:class I SAM-dependent methyltransferase [Fimbriimonadaceae bacterium]
MFRTRCLSCDSPFLHEIVNLGMHPMADTFIPKTRLDSGDRLYPLICDLCERCGQVQLRTVTDPVERYAEYDYSYTSSNSRTSRNHWTVYATAVAGMIGLKDGDAVVEIGSNDGFLAEQFQKLGCVVLGVDPSSAMAQLAAERGVKTLTGLFGPNVVSAVERTLGRKPKLIVANNVFNHANDPREFAQGIKALLAPEGTFVFELPYWLQSVVQRKFDQIYHEHVSYLTSRHAVTLFESIGMRVNHVEEVDYHGGSIRVFVGHKTQTLPTAKAAPSVAEFIEREIRAGLFDHATYDALMKSVRRTRDRFLQKIYRLRSEDQPIVCVGAAAKGNTFLNYYNLDASVIDYVTDSSPSKIGKYTPRTRIPIAADQVLHGYRSVYVIILSWNISAALQTALKAINPHIVFLNPYEQ